MKNADGVSVVVPDELWRGKGGGEQFVRIVDTRRDGRVVIERTAGAPDYALRHEITVEQDQLRQAYEPTGEFDFGRGET